MPLPSNLTATTQAHLDQLIAEAAQETQYLEFKQTLPGPGHWPNELKQELLADVTAFANAGGGELIFGMAQGADGAASHLVLLPHPDLDQELLRIGNFLVDSVEPRLPGVQTFAVPVIVGGAVGHVVVMRVPQSWASPHRVISNRHFYVRENNNRRPVNVPELRGLFLNSANLATKVHDFRSDRIGKIMAGETPYKLRDGSVLVMHIAPVKAALGLVAVDPVQYQGLHRSVPVIASTVALSKLNIDGAVGTRPVTTAGTAGYTILYRNGFIEATWVHSATDGRPRGNLGADTFENYLARFIREVWAELEHWGTTKELLVMLSLLKADKLALPRQVGYADAEQGLFDRQTLIFPHFELLGEGEAHAELKGLFDLVWQAAGYDGSPN